ncbi:hypothetical protein [Streptomyces niveus]|uniref:hypothetical protein n=1 Tax=Streptomyces niveus TaxID=193462 RepID=UPI0034431F50
MADSTDDPAGRESGEPAHQATATDPETREKAAWRAYLAHAVSCTGTCRTPGIDCPQAVELKAAWHEAKRAV